MAVDTSRERRKHSRLDITATAVLFYEGVELGHYLVQNLCAGGALFTGNVGIDHGENVQVILQLANGPPLEIDARVVRQVNTVSDLAALAVEFEHESTTTEDVIHEALLGALDPEYAPFNPDLVEYDEPELLPLY